MADVAGLNEAHRYGGRPKVLFVNDLWGYGTVTIAMAIADEVGAEVTRLFAGAGPGFELARRFAFDGLLRVDTRAHPLPAELDTLLDDCEVVVSVMNGAVAQRAADKEVACLYVDSLAWMWACPPPVPPQVPYFAEAFPGAQSAVEGWRHHVREAEVVGPLVRRVVDRRPSFQDVVLVNFGGLCSWLVDEKTLVAYANAMARCVLQAVEGWNGRVVIAVGRHVLERMDQAGLRAIRPDVDLVDLSHDGYLAELRRSRLLVSSAGMHALYEACAMGVPCVCLPSQNLSGALALRQLRDMDVVRALDWGDLYGIGELDPFDEAEACRRINERVLRFSEDNDAQDGLVRHLVDALDSNELEDLQRREARFFSQQGPLGAPRIAARVLELLEMATVPAMAGPEPGATRMAGA